jgi:hypothetical protein
VWQYRYSTLVAVSYRLVGGIYVSAYSRDEAAESRVARADKNAATSANDLLDEPYVLIRNNHALNTRGHARNDAIHRAINTEQPTKKSTQSNQQKINKEINTVHRPLRTSRSSSTSARTFRTLPPFSPKKSFHS